MLARHGGRISPPYATSASYGAAGLDPPGMAPHSKPGRTARPRTERKRRQREDRMLKEKKGIEQAESFFSIKKSLL